jgi:glycine betaine/proline transport system ATP-binding protein
MAVISFENVDIVFGKRTPAAIRLLDQGGSRADILAQTGCVLGAAGINLEVRRGEICVLMGLSGSGKSTVLRAINRLNKVTRGRVRVEHGDGSLDVTICDERALRALRMRTVATVFQQFALLPWRTVRQNVALGLELRGMAKSARDKIVDEKLAMVGLSAWADKYANELSGGMQQRVGLARAFATDADILLMDEPFSALDPLIRDKLQDELLDLQARLHKTIVFVSHDLDEAMKIGNRIAIMESGRIVQFGTAEDILLRPADAYVVEFVRHMNPLNVLRGHAIMRPCLAQHGLQYLDDAGLVGLELDKDGRPAGIVLAGAAGRIVHCTTEGHVQQSLGADILVVRSDIKLRDAIGLKRQTAQPLVVVDPAGRMIGLCGEAEIYAALLRRGVDG